MNTSNYFTACDEMVEIEYWLIANTVSISLPVVLSLAMLMKLAYLILFHHYTDLIS